MNNLKDLFVASAAVMFSLRGNEKNADKLNAKLPSNMKIELYSNYHWVIGLALMATFTIPSYLMFNSVVQANQTQPNAHSVLDK